MKKTSPVLIFFIVFSLLLFTQLSGCIQQRDYIIHDGLRRSYILHLPDTYSPSNAYPLVLVFHGGGGNAENIEEVSGFSQKADDEEFIVVYPDGTGKLKQKFLTWNCGFCCGYALDHNIDDVGYIRTLIIHLQERYCIDENMIYATGLSNGGIMTYQIGAMLSDTFAAIAPIAAQIGGQATMNEPIWQIPEPDYPVSVMAFHGTADHRVPYDGGRPIDNGSNTYYWMSTNESISFWLEQNQCNSFPQRTISDSGNIIIDTWTGGINDSEVSLVTIVNGSHSWPGGSKGWEHGDIPTTEINATDMMWEFFQSHPKQIGQ